ncbi:MAG: hypothetical protein ACNA7J_13360, partial [Wenzhouxiangella sp.]
MIRLISAMTLSAFFVLAAAAEVRELEWLELMPEEEATAWLSDSAQIDHSGFSAPEPFQSFSTIQEL